MSKVQIKGGTLLAPLPTLMVTVGDMENSNIITIGWAGTICSQPPRMYVSIRKERYSYDMLMQSKDFVANLTSVDTLAACDYCGIRSGRDIDKFAEMNLTKLPAQYVKAPISACKGTIFYRDKYACTRKVSQNIKKIQI